MKLIVASQNPVKLNATEAAFAAAFPQATLSVAGLSVPSGVADQPMSEAETLRGAYNRVRAARQVEPEADFWIGIEGGLQTMPQGLQALAWVVVQGREQVSQGRSAGFMLPPAAEKLLQEGLELGHAMDRWADQTNTKQKGGAVGLLTGGLITRTTLYVPAVTLALIPFLTEGKWG